MNESITIRVTVIGTGITLGVLLSAQLVAVNLRIDDLSGKLTT